ncbi:PTS fructose transporter subunit IIA [Phytophthora palmivora]|uniref:PTS fructose transporter subunit IIA n=1 Tax=Phytophthora palmivora TaxID=4796 RepID=A0A2P4Y242_9STRA|nr:PTS fructose transporter subunit IIA [Phytophthora palmivora]
MFGAGEEELMTFGRRTGLLDLSGVPLASRLSSDPRERSERPEPVPEPAVVEPVPADAESSESSGELVRRPTQDETEQREDNNVAITSDTDYDVRVQQSNAERSMAKTVTDADHARRLVPVDAFGGEYFLDAMRDETLHDDADVDDVDILKTPYDSASESEADEDGY